MKKVIVALCFTCALVIAAQAQEKKDKATPEQKTARKELLDKYDTNKDGKLDKDERAKMSKEDKEKYGKLTGHSDSKDSSKDSKDSSKKDDSKTTK